MITGGKYDAHDLERNNIGVRDPSTRVEYVCNIRSNDDTKRSTQYNLAQVQLKNPVVVRGPDSLGAEREHFFSNEQRKRGKDNGESTKQEVCKVRLRYMYQTHVLV